MKLSILFSLIFVTIFSLSKDINLHNKNSNNVSDTDIHCFVKGTMITMSDFSKKAIEYIQEGDSVLSYNPETKKYYTDVVESFSIREHTDLMKIICRDGTTIISTLDHPFLLSDNTWVSFAPTQTAQNYKYNSVDKMRLGQEVRTIIDNKTIYEIRLFQEKQLSYTIERLVSGNTFVANSFIVGTEELKK